MDEHEELKDNMCKVVFHCFDSISDPCVYKNGRFCKTGSYECTSSVAKVNRMTLELKRLGVEK